MWPMLITSLAPLGIELIIELLALRDKEASGVPLTPADWNNLATKYTTATNEQKARDAIARAGLK